MHPTPVATGPDGEPHRGERLSILLAIDAALADPVRLIGILGQATDDDDAVRRLRDAFGLDDVQAEAVMDLQLRRATPAHGRASRTPRSAGFRTGRSG